MTTVADIASKIAAEQGLTKAQAKSAVEAAFKAVIDAAVAGEETSIPGLGKFKVKIEPAARGPQPCDWRCHDHRCFEEADLHTRESGERCAEGLIAPLQRGVPECDRTEADSGPRPLPADPSSSHVHGRSNGKAPPGFSGRGGWSVRSVAVAALRAGPDQGVGLAAQRPAALAAAIAAPESRMARRSQHAADARMPRNKGKVSRRD